MKPFSLFTSKSKAQATKAVAPLDVYWSRTAESLMTALQTSKDGLSQTEAGNRIKQYGPNALKVQRPDPDICRDCLGLFRRVDRCHHRAVCSPG